MKQHTIFLSLLEYFNSFPFCAFKIKIPPTGMRFVTGISSSYSTEYPEELTGKIDKDEYEEILEKLNDVLISYWPCYTWFLCGYLFAPATFGLSFCCPLICVSEAEKKAHRLLERMGYKERYYDQNISFRLNKSFMYSCLEISFPDNSTAECFNSLSNGAHGSPVDIESNDRLTMKSFQIWLVEIK